MKHQRPLARMMAIAIAGMTMTACSSDDNETEMPFSPELVGNGTLYACGVSQSETRTDVETNDVLFTENDIEWFNVTTREIKFCERQEPLYRRLQPFHEIKFYLDNNIIFVVSILEITSYCYIKINSSTSIR